MDYHNAIDYAEPEATATGTMDTGLPSSETPLRNGLNQKRQAFHAKLRSFESNDLNTIREAVAIIEPPIIEKTSECQPPGLESPSSIAKVSSQPNMLLTVSMPYGSYLGHEVPVSRSQPNLQVTVSLTSLQEIKGSVTKMTSTSDLQDQNNSDYSISRNFSVTKNSTGSPQETDGGSLENELSFDHFNQDDNEDINDDTTDNSDDDDDTQSNCSSCSAGSNSYCSSSYDENCPYCVISITGPKTFSTGSFDKKAVPEVFL